MRRKFAYIATRTPKRPFWMPSRTYSAWTTQRPIAMRRPKLLHPVTADHRREIDIRVLAKAGAFRAPMRFSVQRIETGREHFGYFRCGRITDIAWTRWNK